MNSMKRQHDRIPKESYMQYLDAISKMKECGQVADDDGAFALTETFLDGKSGVLQIGRSTRLNSSHTS